jgi:hypothetical protein
MRNLIRGNEPDPNHPYNTRSESVFAVIIAMVGNGYTDDQIEAVLLNPDNPISAHVLEQPDPEKYLARQIIKAGKKIKGVRLDDFYAYMPMHNYIFTPSGEPWPASSVNSRLRPIPNGANDKGEEQRTAASAWLDQNRPVEQMTWAPGLPISRRRRSHHQMVCAPATAGEDQSRAISRWCTGYRQGFHA